MNRCDVRPEWDAPEGMNGALWRILAARGCRSEGEARAFLNPCERDIIPAGELSGMAESVKIIRTAVEDGKKICVWGDYDVDGVSAVAILVTAFRRLGVEVSYHIPSRGEGYGFNEAGVLALGCDLLISVDCGISEWKIVAKAVAQGMSVIITDHHEPPETVPDCPVINPKLGDYKNRNLCGAGVAFKLAWALCPDCFDLIDIAALATVADVVPLLGENRAIVKLGLKRMNDFTRPGIRALALAAGAKGEIMSQTVAFQLGPRLNAGGRVQTAENSLRLLLSGDADECARIAGELNALNQKRREMENKVLSDCEAMMAQNCMPRANCIALAGEGWPTGVVGLAASRLVEKYNMPTVLLSCDGESMTGSCRSIPGCDIHLCLTRVSGLLERFGGHAQAAGLTLKSVNFNEFCRALDGVITETTPEDAFIPSVYYDCETDLSDITPEFIRSLAALEPTGFGNPPPSFVSRFTVENARRMGKDGAHASFTAVDDTGSARGVWFSGGNGIEGFDNALVTAVYAPSINEFRGEISAQIQIKNMLADRKSALAIDRDREDALVNSFITQMLYNVPVGTANASVTLAQVATRFKNPRGALIVACDREIAEKLCDMPELANAEVCVGRYPTDVRAGDAICLLPTGEIPKGYDTVVVAGLPARFVSQSAAELTIAGKASWLSALPGVDELREIYKACLAFCDCGLRAISGMYLCREIAQRADVAPATAQAGIMILRGMRLIEYGVAPVKLEICPAFKSDPRADALYKAVESIKRWGGSRT